MSKIEEYVYPLVGKVKLEGFNKNSMGSIISIQSKMIKYVREKNIEKIKESLAFCIQEWPDLNNCPLDKTLLKEAINVLK